MTLVNDTSYRSKIILPITDMQKGAGYSDITDRVL